MFKVGTIVTGVMFFLVSAKADDVFIPVPDQDIAGFRFSAMQVKSSPPALDCVVTAPPNTSGTVSIIVLLFDRPDAELPFAKATGSATIKDDLRATCDVNNGPQSTPQRTPKKIEIQISTTAVIAKNMPIILPSEKKP